MKNTEQQLLRIRKILRIPREFLLEVEIVVFYLLNVAIFWPGALSPDSVSQYYQATSGSYTNWHPPIFTYVWSLLLNFTNGAKGMLLLQLLMLWISLYLLAKVTRKYTNNKVGLLVPLIGLSPQILSISGVIWKDVHLAFSLLLCTALLLFVSLMKNTHKTKVSLFVIAGFNLIYSANLRHNAILALLPIIYLFCYVLINDIFSKKISRRKKNKWLIGTLIIFVSFVYLFVPYGLSKIINISDLKPGYQIVFDDIYNLNSEDNISNSTKLGDDSKKYLLGLYEKCPKNTYKTNTLWDCQKVNLYLTSTSKDADSIKKLWIESLINNPISYIKYRLTVYGHFLRSTNPYIWDSGTNNSDLSAPSSRLNRATYRLVLMIEEDFGFLYRNYFGVIFGIALLVTLIRYKSFRIDKVLKRNLIIISSSGILYVLSYTPIVVVPDYRMIYWSTLSISVYSWFTLLVLYNNLRSKKKNNYE